MIIFSVIEIYNGEVRDVRHYGRDELAKKDLTERCNDSIDNLFTGSCMVKSDISLPKINGQRITKKKAAASRNNGKKGGRPVTTGKGIRDPEKRAAHLAQNHSQNGTEPQ
jgi:hypothetical protein